MTKYIDIVFQAVEGRYPSPEWRFVEVEDEHGKSIRAGEWVKRPDGYTVLRILQPGLQTPEPSGRKIQKSGSAEPCTLGPGPGGCSCLENDDASVVRQAFAVAREVWAHEGHVAIYTRVDTPEGHAEAEAKVKSMQDLIDATLRIEAGQR